MSLPLALLNAYYDALNGNVTGFTVYKITIPETETGNFVLLSIEGGADADNKSERIEDINIRVDIVAKYKNDATQVAVETADGIIKDLISPNPAGNALSGTGIEIRNVRRENYVYTTEQPQSELLYRKVSRYSNRVIDIGVES